MNKPLFQIALFVLLALSACVSIPREHRMVSQRGDIKKFQDARDCDTIQLENMLEPDREYKTGLDSSGFKVLNWNVLKGWKRGWKEDFAHLSAGKDILTIQEARLTDDLNGLLQKGRYNWDISTAFTYNGADVGVLTASRLEPLFACTFRIKEPLISIPKTALITLYPLSGTDKYLMVVNIHSINFALGTESFYIQLEKVEEILLRHEGPMIFSGDFNSWSKERMAILKDLSIRLGLEAVTFKRQNRTTVFGHDIDHVYYRGLSVHEAAVIKVTSSDHNPMLVSFTLEEPR
ncbi:MAG: endonuclease/exonuclease/phosphatase family protein [Nitrospiraceae bacterium]|nr:MAG: endonuclease/exonuclease/phosphatase family protein [Nitrospiraceae bacterium]